MRRVVLSAFLALMPALGYGFAHPDAPGGPQASQAQNSPDKQSPPPESARPDPSGSQAAAPADPAKLAAPKNGPAATQSGSLPVDEETYVIGAQDVLGIMVWGQEGFSKISYLVRPDGRITIPFIDEVTAAGRTPEQLARDVSGRLAKFINEPRVTVTLLEVHSKKYYIQGEVLKPGANDLIVPTTVMEGLVAAGGFKDFADQKNIVIIRGDKRLKFNYKDVLKGKNLQQNVYLEPGDIIVVK